MLSRPSEHVVRASRDLTRPQFGKDPGSALALRPGTQRKNCAPVLLTRPQLGKDPGSARDQSFDLLRRCASDRRSHALRPGRHWSEARAESSRRWAILHFRCLPGQANASFARAGILSSLYVLGKDPGSPLALRPGTQWSEARAARIAKAALFPSPLPSRPSERFRSREPGSYPASSR